MSNFISAEASVARQLRSNFFSQHILIPNAHTKLVQLSLYEVTTIVSLFLQV